MKKIILISACSLGCFLTVFLIVACSEDQSSSIEEDQSVVVKLKPTVETIEVIDITISGAKVNAKVTDKGSSSVLKRGVCWSKTGNPTIENSSSKVSGMVSGTGEFETSINDLEMETTYYVRAYATNSVGISYGEEFTFETLEENILEIIPPANFPYVFAKKPQEGKDIYIPNELKNNNFDLDTSDWSYQRSASSDNIILFWEDGFGQYPGEVANTNLQVDIANLLTKAEEYYAYYRDIMKFVVSGDSKSEDYRMIIMLYFQEEWLATGAGYDNVIGALWISPSTTKQHIATIAHEFGHSFQYQTHCDGNYGFRDQNYVGTFWEQCAQYMSWQINNTTYIGEIPYLLNNIHKNFSHEDIRYQSMYLMEYWKEKHGVEILGKVWRKAINPEHPLQAYKRITGITQDVFNNEVFEYASKNITWDYPLGSYNRDFIKTLSATEKLKYSHKTKLNLVADNYYQIGDEQIPQSYGYNAIKLNIPTTGTVVTADFEGLDNDWKDNTGWRWGFVTVKNDGTPIYNEMQKSKLGSSSITILEDIKELWLVVTGAPNEHINHVWDNDPSNEMNFPYKVKFSNTNPI